MAKFQWLDDETRIREAILGDLQSGPKDLFGQLSELDCGCMLLRFLDNNSRKLMTVDDIAYHLVEGSCAIERALAKMKELGIVRQVNVAGLVLYGITSDPEKRLVVRGLCQWQDRWQERMAGIKRVIYGGGIPARAE